MIREIRIQAVLNGFVVRVGCQTIVCESKGKLLRELGRYLENPEGVEAEYLKHTINAVGGPLVEAVQPMDTVYPPPYGGERQAVERGLSRG